MTVGSNNDPKKHKAICSSLDLIVGGLGIRFEVCNKRGKLPGFVVRHCDGLAAYINRCAHLSLELDWNLGIFFDTDQRYLICSTHGALYAPGTGECIEGPCNGLGLETLHVIERAGTVYLNDPLYTLYRECNKPRS